MAGKQTLLHPEIGTISGIDAGQGVSQFLGIQYATIEDRFAPAVLKEYDGKGLDALKVGPQTAPLPQGAQHEQDLIQHRLPETDVHFLETEGLNLNITVPASHDFEKDGKLPIFLFIHGGGFMVSSASYPQYDMARFVRLSIARDLPIIAISMNYRLGPPGLLTSREMREYGYPSNNALRDQRVAMEWVRKYMSGFGGDIDNITLAGESAGAIACTYHLQSRQPLFTRMMAMSGTSLLTPPLPLEVAEQGYQTAIKALGLEGKPVEERMEKLRRMDAGELRAKCAAVPMLPVADEKMPITGHSFANFKTGKVEIAGASWCEAMMIGDCGFDGSIQGLRLVHRKKGIGKAFCDAIHKSLSSQHAEKLLSGYGISADTDDDMAFERVLQTFNDIGFYAPTIAYAEGFGIKTYMYRFNENNPWQGPWQGRATHILDVALLFQNFNDYLDDTQLRTADAFACSVFKFVHGKEPWEAWGGGAGKVAWVLGPDGMSRTVEDVPAKTGRRPTLLDLAKELGGGLDQLAEVLNGFLKAPLAT
ncbi:hypothetical protein LTR56_003335 [Elasticomyces elasticus]|nr:hypothetical protein LTR56_003335 [Elasticomyces elasticus]KAK3664247.1 hypothetical protein LTR22_004945 [Elasticomyces elasticus]KAK4931463.1 hypothetical protein LTR49_002164 [Elasticomyces elasticus]KAK5766018.1 hypothetical protein LTS12_003764 [Elasticomyces elasticus]